MNLKLTKTDVISIISLSLICFISLYIQSCSISTKKIAATEKIQVIVCPEIKIAVEKHGDGEKVRQFISESLVLLISESGAKFSELFQVIGLDKNNHADLYGLALYMDEILEIEIREEYSEQVNMVCDILGKLLDCLENILV